MGRFTRHFIAVALPLAALLVSELTWKGWQAWAKVALLACIFAGLEVAFYLQERSAKATRLEAVNFDIGRQLLALCRSMTDVSMVRANVMLATPDHRLFITNAEALDPDKYPMNSDDEGLIVPVGEGCSGRAYQAKQPLTCDLRGDSPFHFM